MRLSIVEAIIASLLLILIAMVTTEAGSKQQQRLQFLALWPQSHSHGRSNRNEYARSEDIDVGAQLAPTTTSNMKMDQGKADTGRGFMAKLMLFKSMFQPTPPPPPPPTSNIVIVTQPDYTTTPTTTTTTITTPTTTTNSTRGYFTNVVYARQDNSGSAGMIVEEPGMTNRIPMAGQFQRPLQKRIRRNRGQLNKNKRRHRLQLEQQRIASTPSRNQQVKRRRTQMQAAAGSIPLQRKNQRRNVVKIPIQNRVSNRIDNFDANALNEQVGMVNMAGNDLNTNTRLQHFMNAFRQTQTPIVYNH